MEARAYAAGGDSVSAERSLSEAVRVFERRHPGDDPDWFTYFDDAELAAEFCHCFRDTGRFADAIAHADRCMTGSARSDFFVTMVLAAGHLGTGDVEEACLTARRALDLGAAIRSARCVEYLRAFRTQLVELAGLPAIRDLEEYATDHALWRSADPRARQSN